jgi:hypothetical protein
MASGSERRTGAGARTPEELETLLEDAAVMVDAESMTDLFEADAVLVSAGGRTTRGPGAIGRYLANRSSQGGYYADPRTVLQVSDVALVLSPHGINVMRRSGDWG